MWKVYVYTAPIFIVCLFFFTQGVMHRFRAYNVCFWKCDQKTCSLLSKRPKMEYQIDSGIAFAKCVTSTLTSFICKSDAI